jgi:hypothetical protein
MAPTERVTVACVSQKDVSEGLPPLPGITDSAPKLLTVLYPLPWKPADVVCSIRSKSL